MAQLLPKNQLQESPKLNEVADEEAQLISVWICITSL